MKLGLFLSPGDSLLKQLTTGQLERFVRYYLKPYAEKFDQVYLFTYNDSGQKFFLPDKVILVPKPKLLPNYLYQFLLPWLNFKIIKSIDVNRVFQSPGGLPALICKLFFGKPYVVTYGYDYVRFAQIEKQPFLAKIFSLIVPLILRHADKIIITFNNSLSHYETFTVHNGVDPRVFKPGNPPREKYLVLSVGRLVNQKNYQWLIKTISLSRFKDKIKLLIIGLGPLHDRLISLSRKLGVNLVIKPNVGHIQLVAWYQKASVFVLCSRIEGQVKVLLEALSSGTACLTTAFIGNMIEDKVTGMIAENSRQFAALLDRLLSDQSLRQTLGRQARNMIIKNFDLKRLVQQEIKLLQSC